jgi:hypothetical protein
VAAFILLPLPPPQPTPTPTHMQTHSPHPPQCLSCRTYEAEGHDLSSLLFSFLDELLFGFATDLFVAREITIKEFDREHWKIVAEG